MTKATRPARPGLPPMKLDELRSLMLVGEWTAALKLAATFARLGDHKAAITRGWEAAARPGFYRAIGKDPDALVNAGVVALQERYGPIWTCGRCNVRQITGSTLRCGNCGADA